MGYLGRMDRSEYDRTFGPTEEELREAERPSFRMPSAGRRTPIQGPQAPGVPLKDRALGLGEAAATVGSLVAGAVPAGVATMMALPFEGVRGAAKRGEAVSDAMMYLPRSEPGERALEALAGPMEAVSAPATSAAEAVLSRTGSPLAATVTEMALDPFNLLAAPAVPAVARGAARGARAAGRAAKAAGRELGPKAAEMAEGYMRRAGLMPQAVPSAPSMMFDDALMESAVRDSRGATGLIDNALQTDAQGIVRGRAKQLDRDLAKGLYTENDVKQSFASTLDQIRSRFGDTVKLWRADAPDAEKRPDTRTVFMADEATARQYEKGGREAKPYIVNTDDILGVYARPSGYREVIVRRSALDEQRLPQTDTPAFKEFTGGAPVIKADQASKAEFQTGKPVVIEGFSGTRRDFSEIDPAQSSAGYFLSSKPVVADEYAGVYPEGMGGGSFPTGGNIQRSFVRMDNPLFVNARGASFNRIDTRGIPGFGLPMSNTDMLNHWAKQQGYDGVIYKDLRDSISRPGGQNAPASNVYVSFKPNYVKSAIGNRGTFDVQSRDMTKAQGGAVQGNSMGYSQTADMIAAKLMDQGVGRQQALQMALRMADAHMKAGGAVLMAGGGRSVARGLKRAVEATREQQTKRAVEAARKAEAARAARTETEKSVVEKFGQKQEQEAARAAKVQQLSTDAPQREVAPTGRRVKAQPDVYRKMAEQQGEGAVLRAARAGEHLKPTPQGYVGAPRTVTNPQALGAMRRAMDKDFADSVEAVRLADPERLGTWYDRAKMGIAESSEPYQLPRVLEQHGVYSAGVSPESELGFALKHQNTRVLGEPGMAYRGAPMRNLDEAVAQNRPAKMGFKIDEYMKKNDPRLPNAGLFGVNDFRRAQGMGYTDPAGNPWKAGVSETMHPFMDAETALQVDRANKGAIGGRTDWAGPHIQEVPWVYGKAQDLYSRGQKGRFKGDELAGIKQSLVEANNTARDYMYKHAASATHEAVPGASLGHVPQVLDMTPEQKAAYGATGRWDLPAPEAKLSDMPGVGAGNRDILYGALGLRQLPSRQGSGLYINSLGGVETNPMTVARPLMDFPTGGGGLMAPLSRKAMEATEAFRALMDAQEAGAFNLPNTMGAVKNKNSLLLDARGRGPRRLEDPSAGALPTAEQLSKMNEELDRLQARRMDVGPLRDPGFGVAPTSRGAVVFPYKADMDPAEAARALRSVKKDLTKIFPSDPQMSLSTMGYVPGVGKRGQFGPEGTAPYSGEATIDKLQMFADLPPEVALSLGESEAVRAQIREKALRDAKLGRTRGDIQETRRFFSEADWPRAVEMIRQGMSPAAALAALGYSASSMAGQE